MDQILGPFGVLDLREASEVEHRERLAWDGTNQLISQVPVHRHFEKWSPRLVKVDFWVGAFRYTLLDIASRVGGGAS